MGRILAVDYGMKRSGVAVSDPMQIIAQGLTTVETCRLEAFLESYFEKEDVESVVVGRPVQPSGADSENAARVDSFVEAFRARFPSVPVETYDERFTSVMAHDAMLRGGLGKVRRRDKALVDRVSATIILEGYMESRRIKESRGKDVLSK